MSGGLLPPAMRGTNISSPIHICDWYSTFCGLAGVNAADNHEGVPPVDSIDMWPVVSGATKAFLRTECVTFASAALRLRPSVSATKGGTLFFVPTLAREPDTALFFAAGHLFPRVC